MVALVTAAVMTLAIVVLGTPAHTVDASPRSTVAPSAERSQAPAAIPAVHIVGLGDSVMSGTACGCDGIPAQYARVLASSSRMKVSAQNLGEGGATAASTEADLRSGAIDRAVIASADVLLVIVGANDLGPADEEYEAGGCDASCYEPLVKSMEQHLTSLFADLRRLTGPRAQILVGTYWNVFPDGDPSIVPGGQSEIEWSRSLTADTNEAICRAARLVSASCVDLVAPFLATGNPIPLLVEDGDHPNSAGVGAIVNEFVNATDTEALARSA